jgi:hypothetical protein
MEKRRRKSREGQTELTWVWSSTTLLCTGNGSKTIGEEGKKRGQI